MKFGQLILRRIAKIVTTKCQIFRLKCTKINFGIGRGRREGRVREGREGRKEGTPVCIFKFSLE